ncbi:hypothetical protein ACLOAU_14670 [Niabella sp. CJ426]|uniref:hypothetical protein n=1 Tax=Niabella sp. CJ426 TaxID=3393740 RepID=UPI003D060D83
MLCATLRPRNRACGPTTGGVSDVAAFDPNDLNFTQGADVSGAKAPYTAVALRATAVAPVVFPVTFKENEAELKFTQSRNGCSVKYEHELDLSIEDLDQSATQFLQAVDAAACCCGLGFFVRLNSGKIFVMGEKYVNADEISKFKIVQDGSTGTTGKLFEDFNGVNLVFKGSYSRALYEYSGTWASVIALTTEA